LAEAIDMASIRPALSLNLPVQQGLAVGAPLDAIMLRSGEGNTLQLVATYKQGAEVWRCE